MQISQVLQCIQENFDNSSFDCNTIYCVCGHSSSHIRSKIRQEYGCTLQELLEILRVVSALDWITKKAEIESFYMCTGFNTAKTMRDAFHRRLGYSPSKCGQLLQESTNKSELPPIWLTL